MRGRLGHQLAAVDLDDLAGDVAAEPRRREIEESASAVLGRAEALQGNPLARGLQLLGRGVTSWKRVAIVPGETAFTWMPWGASSVASALVNVATNALAPL